MEEKQTLALFTWFVVYVDDQVSTQGYPIQSFQRRCLSGQRRTDPLLDALMDVFHRLWDFYDTLSCNGIIRSAQTFMTSSCIEKLLETVPLVPNVTCFPWYIRKATGLATCYATFWFTKSCGFQAMDFIQALPDIEFYKEELQGETRNCVRTRSQNENKGPVEILSEIEGELVASRNTIYAALAHNSDALAIWKAFEQEYIHWHLTQDRYKPREPASRQTTQSDVNSNDLFCIFTQEIVINES
ncbi:hypothetical protein M422DRAFT_239367 [Sphaerobolus stellatus SS14]|nr:hypothetical protein M422DRAFT_239367 [Sphaerobolus stellatus SS14]